MDSVLNEITYSDGRMDMQRAEFIDTPAKLKLRANTYQGINRSLRARRNPVSSTSGFQIPRAYMAMDTTPAGSTSGGVSGSSDFTIIEGNLQNQQFTDHPTIKRLRINAGQKALFMEKATAALSGGQVVGTGAENVPVSENAPGVEAPTVAETPITPDIPVAPVEPVVSTPPVAPVEAVTPEVPVSVDATPVPEQPAPSVDDAIDAAREKVLASTAENNAVQQAENMDSFAKLQQATKEYEQMNEEIKQADARLEAGRKDLQGLQDKYSEIGKSLESQELEIHEKMEVIGEHERETAKIQENIEALNRKIEDKLRYVEVLKKKRADEKRKKEEEAEKILAEREEVQRKIDDRQMKVDELFEKSKTLEEKEREALREREEAQRVLEEKNTLYEAITLPEIEGMEDAYEEEVNVVEPSIEETEMAIGNDAEMDASDVMAEEVEEDGPSMVRSLGKAA